MNVMINRAEDINEIPMLGASSSAKSGFERVPAARKETQITNQVAITMPAGIKCPNDNAPPFHV